MTENLPTLKADTLEFALREHLGLIRDEDVPERLLDLARDLQTLLRGRDEGEAQSDDPAAPSR